MKLLFDLKDVDGKIIAGEGSVINRTLIKKVMERGLPLQKKFTSLNHPHILRDTKSAISEEVYQQMFAGVHDRVLAVVRQCKLQTSLFKEIMLLRKSSNYTYRHFLLIGALAARMSLDLKSYGYDAKEAFVLGLTHDIGKTRLPTGILNKTTPLSSNEYRILHSYPNSSLLLLRYYLGKKGTEACRVAYDHHEKMDGSGYPRGIKNISKYTKLIAIIDIFDALIADRPYRKRGFTVRGAVDKLIDEMQEGKLPRYPILILISMLRKDKPNYRKIKFSRHAREIEPEGNSYGKVSQ